MEPPAHRLPDNALYRDVDRVLFTRQQIRQRVRTLAEQIAHAYAGRDLTIVAVLTGAMIFLADLIREMPMLMRIDVTSISSYPGQATRSVGPTVLAPPRTDLADRDVLLVDDILDSGQTLTRLLELVGELGPRDLRSCVLLRKKRADLPDRRDADWAGFDVPDEFVVGYGLDYGHLYRNLPEICVLKPGVYGGDA